MGKSDFSNFKGKYILCRFRMNEHTSSIYGHPFDAIASAMEIDPIKTRVKELILRGVPVSELRIMREIDFEALCAVKIIDEEENDESN